jgi:hypothetical protein
MRVPAYLKPETKQFCTTVLSTGNTNDTYSSILLDMTQGDDGDRFIGCKFRVQRLRVNYDFTGLTLTSGIRMSVVISKSAATTPAIFSSRQQWDTDRFTVLHDMLLPTDDSVRCGTFDVTGPINCELDKTGGVALRNNIWVYAYSTGQGVAMRQDISYAVSFTDA